MARITEYIAKENDRWDLVAYKAYGDVTKIPTLIEANPGIAANPFIEAGTVINVPILPSPTATNTLLPPWKR